MATYCPRCGHTAEVGGACPHDGTALVEAAPHDIVGRTLGAYTVLARIGGGAFGHVYRAIHPRSNLVVAIKLLDLPIDDADGQRAITEARAAALVSHPNVVQILDLGFTSDRRPFIVMEHLLGETLAPRWSRRMTWPEVAPIATAMLRGLAAAHARGIVHRDLKPENVFVTADDRVVIVDFGLAKLLADPRTPNLTVTGASLGTPRYMSPEQIKNGELDQRSDLYAVAVMLYEALAGGPPFDGSSTFQVFDAHVNAPPPLGQLPREVPAHVVAAIERGLAKQPSERFADADAMRRALAGRALARRRSKWPLVAGGALIAGLAAIAIVATASSASSSKTSARTGSSGPAPPRQFVMPTDEALAAIRLPPASGPTDPNEERALRLLAFNLAHEVYTVAEQTEMTCSTATALRRLSEAGAVTDPDLRRTRDYLARMRQLLRNHMPDFDESTCAPAR